MNPVERVWLYLKERFLSHRLLDDYDAIVTAACNAWNRLVARVLGAFADALRSPQFDQRGDRIEPKPAAGRPVNLQLQARAARY